MDNMAGASILILGNKCYRCSHEWVPSNKNQVSRVCPKCKSPYWDRPKVKFVKNKKKRINLKK